MAGGGPLFDVGSHRIDAMHFLFGKAERVSGRLSNTVHRIAVEDSATLVLEFAGNIHGVVDVRWNSHTARDQFRIIGTEGEINLDPLNGPELRVHNRAGSQVEMLSTHANVHYPLVLNFVGAVLANSPAALVCSGEEGQWVDWTIEQAMQESRDD
jgi:predicted dehydrogenase